jgi:hypothetical protein
MRSWCEYPAASEQPERRIGNEPSSCFGSRALSPRKQKQSLTASGSYDSQKWLELGLWRYKSSSPRTYVHFGFKQSSHPHQSPARMIGLIWGIRYKELLRRSIVIRSMVRLIVLLHQKALVGSKEYPINVASFARNHINTFVTAFRKA